MECVWSFGSPSRVHLIVPAIERDEAASSDSKRSLSEPRILEVVLHSHTKTVSKKAFVLF
jgi:hypothetical protein